MTRLESMLRKLRAIEPDQDYANRSLSAIVTSPRKSKSYFSFNLFHIAEYSAAVALVGLFIFMIVGNFNLSQVFSPIQPGSLSSGSLRAEAEAIDIQIKLLDVNYTANSSTPAIVSTPVVRKKIAHSQPVIITTSETTSTLATTTTSTPPTIEEILDLIAQ